jgi:hypothetical protein
MLMAGHVSAIDVPLTDRLGNAQTPYGSWGSVVWNSLPVYDVATEFTGGINEQRDIVGDAPNPGGYWGANEGYVFIRMRLDADFSGNIANLSDFQDAHMVLIDVVGQHFDTGVLSLVSGDDQYPDYAFAWDSKSNIVDSHGLEMTRRDTIGTNWGGNTMYDVDGNAGGSNTADINYGNSTEGYLEVVDGGSTTNFGTTTFLDFAVSWNYLITNTALRPGQQWNISFATMGNSTDHAALGLQGDIIGGVPATTPVTVGWNGPISPVPEPSTLVLVLPLAGVLLATRRRRA